VLFKTLDSEEVETEVGLESEIVETESIFNVIERNPRHPQGEIVEIASQDLKIMKMFAKSLQGS
jgi:hypothetical protein